MKAKKIATSVAAVAGVILLATPAGAVDWPSVEPGRVENSAGSMVAFASEGDYIGVNDWAFDGKSAVGLWETDYGRTGKCVDSDGAQNGMHACNYDMAESGYVRFKVCHQNLSAGTSPTGCSAWSKWVSISSGSPR
ncbi:hypothetical protein OG379_18840 [Streptomyces sp. NBC_01166]|uniref:hypothetical protein n=1 Tax=unclassified Streptomyces TaxID=2593676 RepID=UPI00371B520D|nr:hypothetical protein OG379_18840 [Streptomyces sp. NBC_01166]